MSNYTFEHDGKTYEFEKPLDEVRKPGFIRANRRRDEIDLVFTILEAVAGEEVLDVVDNMTEDEFKVFVADLEKNGLGATSGESSRS